MMNTKPLRSVPEKCKPSLADYTWEQRRNLTAAELIEAMGPLHALHPDFKPRPRSLLPMPNVAGKQPTISCTDYSLLGQIMAWIRWAFL